VVLCMNPRMRDVFGIFYVHADAEEICHCMMRRVGEYKSSLINDIQIHCLYAFKKIGKKERTI